MDVGRGKVVLDQSGRPGRDLVKQPWRVGYFWWRRIPRWPRCTLCPWSPPWMRIEVIWGLDGVTWWYQATPSRWFQW